MIYKNFYNNTEVFLTNSPQEIQPDIELALAKFKEIVTQENVSYKIQQLFLSQKIDINTYGIGYVQEYEETLACYILNNTQDQNEANIYFLYVDTNNNIYSLHKS